MLGRTAAAAAAARPCCLLAQSSCCCCRKARLLLCASKQLSMGFRPLLLRASQSHAVCRACRLPACLLPALRIGMAHNLLLRTTAAHLTVFHSHTLFNSSGMRSMPLAPLYLCVPLFSAIFTRFTPHTTDSARDQRCRQQLALVHQQAKQTDEGTLDCGVVWVIVPRLGCGMVLGVGCRLIHQLAGCTH